ncbi:26S proteasome non-ATPase regulatory subunit 4 homolog [Rutidosis leptorrhynchoides]|uniref:26S proteasome non-ATPase regulatory subunit 4 homolog n=1 Tax=Rutidosis leptorrhynchoides TaxID=125765 RepID=UPI003A9911ED
MVAESNPKNMIGIFGMGGEDAYKWLEPTRKLDKIMSYLKGVLDEPTLSGGLDFKGGISLSRWCFSFECEKSSERRLLLFIGGYLGFGMMTGEHYGKSFNKTGVAVDVLHFLIPNCYVNTKLALDALVAAANNNYNNHIKHFELTPDTLASDIISRYPDIFPSDSAEEEEIARNKNAKDPKGKNQAAHYKYVKADNNGKVKSCKRKRGV